MSTKVHLVKAMVFPVVMYGCESWTVRKAERRKIDTFELWCWRRLLRVPWTARRSNQSILKDISPGCSLEGLMMKLKLQYFGHLMRRVDLLEKTLMLGGIGGRRKRGRQRMRWLDGITDSWAWVWVNSGSWWWTGRPGVLWFMGSQRVGNDWATELTALMGRALLSKALIRLSADGWSDIPSLIVAWPKETQPWGYSRAGLVATSKRAYTMGDLAGPWLSMFLILWWAPADGHLHRRPTNTSR